MMPKSTRSGMIKGTTVLAYAALLGACVVQERVYTPPPRVYSPPPRAYTPPPPPVVDAEVEVTASEAPPPLPDYEQPPIPEPGYLWTPGYWAWGVEGYYWVPGTWVQPPRLGVLWTPGYWGWGGGVYVFHAGYWGPHVGFYGGVNYGGGYVGVGFGGGRWVNNAFAYNTAVTNVNVNIVHNTYNETVVNNNVTVNRVSYNGGAGGVAAAPTAHEQAAARETHVRPTASQTEHVQEAAHNRSLLAKVNQGRPAIAATPRPGAFNAPSVVPARAAGFSGNPGGNAAVNPAGGAAHETGGSREGRPGEFGAANTRGLAAPSAPLPANGGAPNVQGNARAQAQSAGKPPVPGQPKSHANPHGQGEGHGHGPQGQKKPPQGAPKNPENKRSDQPHN